MKNTMVMPSPLCQESQNLVPIAEFYLGFTGQNQDQMDSLGENEAEKSCGFLVFKVRKERRMLIECVGHECC